LAHLRTFYRQKLMTSIAAQWIGPYSGSPTYTGAFDPIRQVFAATVEAKARGYQVGQFSFNVKGGRCEACSGQGVNVI
jgi:excinuclease ABC subunit A